MTRALCVALTLALGAGCTASERQLAPEDLDARDLLGLSPPLASRWDADARAAARGVLEDAWAEGAALPAVARVLTSGGDRQAAAATALRDLDAERAAADLPPLIGGVLSVGDAMRVASAPAMSLEGAPAEPLPLDPIGWGEAELELVWRGDALVGAVARAGGHTPDTALPVRPAARAPFGAVYAGADIGVLVNPVMLAALEPLEGEAAALAGEAAVEARRAGLSVSGAAGDSSPGIGGRLANAGVGGNPYSFFGSVAECAAYQRLRCDGCLDAGSCESTARDASSGLAECEALSAGDGRGYFLYCANLALAISTVAECADGGSCDADRDASNQLDELETNAAYVDDEACLDTLDDCLGDIFGDPDDDYPGPGPTPDGGPEPEPPPPPRDTEVSCGEADCDFSPQCDADCNAGSCGEVFSCDADCTGDGTDTGTGDSGDGCGDGSGGGCDCDGDGGGGCNDGCGDSGGGGGSDSGCGGGDGGGSGGDGGGCGGGSDSGGGDSGGGCGGGGGGGDSGGGCGGGGCGGGGGGDSGGCGGGGGGSGGGCVVAGGAGASAGANASGNVSAATVPARASCPRRSSAPALLALMWAILPLSYLERCRRRARRAARRAADGGAP